MNPRFPEVVADIADCERRLCAAQLASDVRALDELIADELIFVDLAGRIATKPMDLEAHRTGLLKIARSQVKEQDIRILTEDTAVVIVKIALAGAFGATVFEGDFRYTRVWQKRASGWHIVAGHMSAVA